jgi:hypothetical protein
MPLITTPELRIAYQRVVHLMGRPSYYYTVGLTTSALMIVWCRLSKRQDFVRLHWHRARLGTLGQAT